MSNDADWSFNATCRDVILIGSLDFFTKLSLGNAGMLFKKLREKVTLVCRIILEEDGDIDKLMGDKVLGVFPVSDGDGITTRDASLRALYALF